MKRKDCAIIIMSTVIFILLVYIKTLSNRITICKDYIERLEEDFPDYLDVTSGTDEYYFYYEYIN